MSMIKKITGLPYEGIMRLRRKLYHAGMLKSFSVDVPIICVGNITTGGTGKTPMVAWVVKKLVEKGKTPAILTRGYKAVDGKSDEAALLEQLTGVKVVVNGDRVAGAKLAMADGADVLVMDDGFQHMRLRREMNIVLIDASNPFGGGGCLPLGRLREGTWALRDADIIVITRSDAIPQQQLDELKRFLARHSDCEIAAAVHRPTGLIDLAGSTHSLDEMQGKTAWLFCGVGNPKAFERTVSECGLKVVGTASFSDHAHYDTAATEKIKKDFATSGADVLITTRKDGVKLNEGDFTALPLYQLDIEIELSGSSDFLDKIF